MSTIARLNARDAARTLPTDARMELAVALLKTLLPADRDDVIAAVAANPAPSSEFEKSLARGARHRDPQLRRTPARTEGE